MNEASENTKAPLQRGKCINQNTQANNTSNSADTQRARVLSHLKSFGSATTIDLRRDLDVMMPAARVHELRHKFGYNIHTIWVHQQTDCGKLHRVAKYALKSNGAHHG